MGGFWAEVHGGDRQTSGFSVNETVSEFRALRASVVSHWTKAYPTISGQQLEDLTRFHEAIDQAVAESLEQYSTVKEMETRLLSLPRRFGNDKVRLSERSEPKSEPFVSRTRYGDYRSGFRWFDN